MTTTEGSIGFGTEITQVAPTSDGHELDRIARDFDTGAVEEPSAIKEEPAATRAQVLASPFVERVDFDGLQEPACPVDPAADITGRRVMVHTRGEQLVAARRDTILSAWTMRLVSVAQKASATAENATALRDEAARAHEDHMQRVVAAAQALAPLLDPHTKDASRPGHRRQVHEAIGAVRRTDSAAVRLSRLGNVWEAANAAADVSQAPRKDAEQVDRLLAEAGDIAMSGVSDKNLTRHVMFARGLQYRQRLEEIRQGRGLRFELAGGASSGNMPEDDD